ncbi:MAG: rod shape-determining protein MreC [bacterium]|nr:rod shape-determining protein MreC [bacterium]
MIYQERDNKRKKNRKIRTILIVFLLISITFLLNFFAPHFLSPMVHAVGVPAGESRGFFAEHVRNIINLLQSKRSLVMQNRELREKQQLFSALEAEKTRLHLENISLKSQLGRKEVLAHEIIAYIVSKPGFSPYDTLIIDVGEKDGVKAGDLVVADRSIIIGEIESVLPGSSKVISYSSSGYKTDIFIGEKSIQTIAEGKGGGNFEVKLPRNADVKEGDTVMLSKYPDKLFGTITSIKISDSDTFERILFRGIVDINQLQFVTVEKKQ